MATYEGLWDCPNCNKVGNRGSGKHCVGCGRARGENIEFYLPEDAAEITDESELAKSQRGPDWTCPYCEGDNLADSQFCANCGAAKDGSKSRQVKDTMLPEETEPVQAPKDYSGLRKFGLGCLAVFILLILAGLWAHRDRAVTLQVMAHSWKRTIETEDFKTLDQSAWAGEVPGGARVYSRRSEIHHTDHIRVGSNTRTRQVEQKVQSGTRKVKAGKRNKGNGYFEDIYKEEPVYKTISKTETYEEPIYRDEPVYRDKVFFRVDRWTRGSPAVREGNDLNPVWPEVSANSTHRAGARQEEYTLQLQDSKKNLHTYRCANETDWRGYKDNTDYPAVLSGNSVKSLGARP